MNRRSVEDGLARVLTRPSQAYVPLSARADRRCIHATTDRSRSTSRFRPDHRTGFHTGRTRRIQVLSESSSSHSFRLREPRSGSLPDRLFFGLFLVKFEGNTVHTVPQPGRPRAVLEDMPEVAFAARTVHLCPFHPEFPVGCRLDRTLDWRPETRPAGTAVKLCVRREEVRAAARAPEYPVPVLLIKRARAGPLGSMHA